MSPKKTENGIYYFIGSIASHALHALPLYKEMGGTFVVTSKNAYDALQAYDVQILMIDDRPHVNLNFGYTIKKTIDYLNKHAKVVLFYEVYDFPAGSRLHKPYTFFLTHGNILKHYFSEKRLKALERYNYMAGLGPYNKNKFISELGIPSEKVIDIGIARTDEVVRHRGHIYQQQELNDELGFAENQPIITYMPTYWGASSVHNVGKDIIRNIPDIYNVIFRPHPQTPEHIIYEYLNIIDSKEGQVIYATEGQFKNVSLTDMYNASSLIIGDISSVMLEAILIDKPLVFAYDNGGHQQNEKDIESIKNVVDYSSRIDINNVKNTELIVQNALKRGIDQAVWQSTKDYTFFNNDGTSVKAIVSFIKKFT